MGGTGERRPGATMSALLALCARICRDPGLVCHAARVPARDGIRVAEHAHPDLLQFDVAVGCQGGWRIGGAPVEASRCTLLVFTPGVLHGYRIDPGGRSAEVCNVKIRVEPDDPVLRAGFFPALLRDPPIGRVLHRCLQRLSRLRSAGDLPLMAAAAVEMLCLWPRSEAASAGGVVDDDTVQAAMAYVEERIAKAPQVAQLARAVGLSERQLARRFRLACGCSPRRYVARRRLQRAKELLATGRQTVTEVAETLGFTSVHVFSRWFRRESGGTPGAYRDAPDLL
jgi:AraC-like DNA-binding protein